MSSRDEARLAACGWVHDPDWQAQSDAHLRTVGWDTLAADLPRTYRHARAGLAAMVGREPCPGDATPRWHISVSAPDGVPAWDLLVKAAHDLRPGVVFCVGVPPRSMWMNVHPNVLHLHELRDENLIAEYRENARGDAPS